MKEIEKLYRPEEFSIKEIIDFSVILELNPQMILDVILKQVNTPVKSGRKKASI